MSIYIFRGRYNSDALRGMMTSHEDREAILSSIFAKAGGKLLSYYVTLGEDDFLFIAECPDNSIALSVAIVGVAGGSVSDLKTAAAFTSGEAVHAFKAAADLAASFKSAGR